LIDGIEDGSLYYNQSGTPPAKDGKNWRDKSEPSSGSSKNPK